MSFGNRRRLCGEFYGNCSISRHNRKRQFIAWTSFTDHLRFTDFFFRGGLLSLSISFIPKLLFNVVKAGFNAVEGVHTFFFGGPSKAAEDLQTYKNDMSALRADAKSQRG